MGEAEQEIGEAESPLDELGQEYEKLEACPMCKALDYKIRRDDPGNVEEEAIKKKSFCKVIRIFSGFYFTRIITEKEKGNLFLGPNLGPDPNQSTGRPAWPPLSAHLSPPFLFLRPPAQLSCRPNISSSPSAHLLSFLSRSRPITRRPPFPLHQPNPTPSLSPQQVGPTCQGFLQALDRRRRRCVDLSAPAPVHLPGAPLPSCTALPPPRTPLVPLSLPLPVTAAHHWSVAIHGATARYSLPEPPPLLLSPIKRARFLPWRPFARFSPKASPLRHAVHPSPVPPSPAPAPLQSPPATTCATPRPLQRRLLRRQTSRRAGAPANRRPRAAPGTGVYNRSPAQACEEESKVEDKKWKFCSLAPENPI
ncbi:proline-rich protein 36-like [Setaria italica]|uniref:proline-rich protein 36-like n=1 Tax=Setaria italica TaxID=4555 RepID=UPI000BE57DFD|nr:proline-rich protein 36-like [Setaria italica]